MEVHYCRVFKTSVVSTCKTGQMPRELKAYAHWDEPIAVTDSECRQYWTRLEYTDTLFPRPGGNSLYQHKLVTKSFNTFSYDKGGISSAEPSQCLGISINATDQLGRIRELHDVTINVQMNIMLDHEFWYIDPNATAFFDPLGTPVRSNTCWPRNMEYSCSRNNTRFVWNFAGLSAVCHLEVIKPIEGIEVEIPEYEYPYLFLSQDGSQIRLPRSGSPRPSCGGYAFPTNHPKLFLADVQFEMQWEYPHPGFESTKSLTPSNLKDTTLRGYLSDPIVQEISYVLQQQCESNHIQISKFLQLPLLIKLLMPQAQSLPIGQGKFLTPMGEVWYSYHCPEITVYYQEWKSPNCPDVIPVQLKPQDLSRWVRNHQGNPPTQFFVEPLSRRLVDSYAPQICNSGLPFQFQTLERTWHSIPKTRNLTKPISFWEAFLPSSNSATRLTSVETRNFVKLLQSERRIHALFNTWAPKIISNLNYTCAPTTEIFGSPFQLFKFPFTVLCVLALSIIHFALTITHISIILLNKPIAVSWKTYLLYCIMPRIPPSQELPPSHIVMDTVDSPCPTPQLRIELRPTPPQTTEHEYDYPRPPHCAEPSNTDAQGYQVPRLLSQPDADSTQIL